MLAEKIKTYRTQKKLSMQDLERISGISKENLYKWEKGTKPTDFEAVKKLEKIINEDYKDLQKLSSDVLKEPQVPYLTEKGVQININSNSFKPIPFYSLNVSAGDIIFLDDGLLQDALPDDYMFVPKNIDADIAFPTYGTSMQPFVNNGDRVAYKHIKDWSFFNYGMMCLIITEEQRMLKYLKKHQKEGYILLQSANEDFDVIDMPINKIKHILQARYIGKTIM